MMKLLHSMTRTPTPAKGSEMHFAFLNDPDSPQSNSFKPNNNEISL
ncbi:hypothetical protein [Vibrio sp. ES.051]|nr:hypothetical protein [Vibrio sp. ES.051]